MSLPSLSLAVGLFYSDLKTMEEPWGKERVQGQGLVNGPERHRE